MVHAEEEAAGCRLLVNGLTVLLEAEADPSRLLASSPGKLTRQLVTGGSRVAADQPYAEMEVRPGGGGQGGWGGGVCVGAFVSPVSPCVCMCVCACVCACVCVHVCVCVVVQYP